MSHLLYEVNGVHYSLSVGVGIAHHCDFFKNIVIIWHASEFKSAAEVPLMS